MKPLFVQIKCDLGRIYQVSESIVDGIEETSEIYSTSGEYDLLAKFYLSEHQSVGHFVNTKLHCIAGVKDTHTLIAFRLFAPEQSDGLAIAAENGE
jgi:DNA-binding Lrp family transcriptional regulator